MLENCINKTVQNITDLLPSFALPIVLLFTPAPDFLKKSAWIAPVAKGTMNILKDQELVDNMNLQNAMCGLTIFAITGTTLNSSIPNKYKCFCAAFSCLMTFATYKPEFIRNNNFVLASLFSCVAGVAIAISDDLSNHQSR